MPLALAALSPEGLYKALLASSITESQLPAGFHSAKATALKPGPNPKRHHVVGEVVIDLNNGDAQIVYVIFPTRADTLGYFADALKQVKAQKRFETRPAPAGLPKPAVVVIAKPLRITQVSMTAGNVGIVALTNDDIPAAVSLARFGLGHLNAVK